MRHPEPWTGSGFVDVGAGPSSRHRNPLAHGGHILRVFGMSAATPNHPIMAFHVGARSASEPSLRPPSPGLDVAVGAAAEGQVRVGGLVGRPSLPRLLLYGHRAVLPGERLVTREVSLPPGTQRVPGPDWRLHGGG